VGGTVRISSVAFLLLVAGCGHTGNIRAPSVLPVNPPPVHQGSLDGAPLLAEVAEQAKKLGAGALSVAFSQELTAGERGGAFVSVPKDVCLLAFARASAAVDDIDLATFSDDGNPISIDEAPDARPTVVVCPPHPERVYVAVHVAEGEGLVAVGAQYVTKEKGVLLARALGARGALGGAIRRPEAWPGLDRALEERRDALRGTWEEQRRVALSIDASAPSYVSITAEPNSCIDTLVMGDDDVSDLDIELIDRTGRIVGRSRDTSAARGLVMCTKDPFSGNVMVRPHAGRGLAAVVLQRTKMEAMNSFGRDVDVVVLGEGRPLAETRKSLEGALSTLSYGAALRTVEVSAVAGRRASLTTQLPTIDGCYRVDALADSTGPAFDFTTRFENGNVISRGVAFGQSTSFFCGGGALVSEFDVRARASKIAVVIRKEPWADPQLTKAPIASGRMLRRALGEPSHRGEKASKLGLLTLEAGKRSTWATTIPENRCSRITIGVEGPGVGFEARLFDTSTDEEMDRLHSVESGAVQACTKGEARAVRLEITPTTGKLEAIVGERTFDF